MDSNHVFINMLIGDEAAFSLNILSYCWTFKCFVFCYVYNTIYRTQQRDGEDNGPEGHEDETSHQHEPPTFVLDQQVLKTHRKVALTKPALLKAFQFKSHLRV